MFKQQKNKRFNYKPRHINNNTQGDKESLEEQWQKLKTDNKRKTSVFNSMTFLILLLLAILILSYVLGSYE